MVDPDAVVEQSLRADRSVGREHARNLRLVFFGHGHGDVGQKKRAELQAIQSHEPKLRFVSALSAVCRTNRADHVRPIGVRGRESVKDVGRENADSATEIKCEIVFFVFNPAWNIDQPAFRIDLNFPTRS